MPFKCKCGQTFERSDSFQGHTSACPRFHSSSMSSNNSGTPSTPGAPGGSSSTMSTPIRKNSISAIIINTSSFNGQPSPSFSTSPLSTSPSPSTFYTSTTPNGSFNFGMTSTSASKSLEFVPMLPASLSLQSTFAGARRRSMTTTSLQAQN